ncbi:MAG: riboflavin synthase [Fimbriimonas sp.]
MFTGIVQAVGRVQRIGDFQLEIEAPETLGEGGYAEGESIAINGCCLTVVGFDPLRFDLSEETLVRTNLGDLKEGDGVNLERAMSARDRFGGHIVQGHVDATGEVVAVEPQEDSTVVRFRIPAEYERYLIDKGSVTIDGISLTVVRPEGDTFETWIIPHTLANTNLGRRQAGDRVNLEFDVIAKYVERLLAPHRG